MFSRLLNLLPAKTLHGYENPELVEVLFQKNIAFSPTEPWPDMAGASTVLDIGGSFGLHYKQAANPTVRWAVVETPSIVDRAKPLETDRLRFFTSTPEAAQWLGKVETVHCNGAVQYAADPLALVGEAVATRPDRLLWYRLFLGEGEGIQTSLLRENGPGKLKTPHRKVAYRFSRISEADFIAAHDGYRAEARGPDWFKFSRLTGP